MAGELRLMHDRFRPLSPQQRERALDWMIGTLSAHVTPEQWREAIEASIEMAVGPGRGPRPREHEAPEDHKMAAAGERVEA